jgi:hypothetical protein
MTHVRAVLGWITAPMARPAVRKAGQLAAAVLAAIGAAVTVAGNANAAIAHAGTVAAKAAVVRPAGSGACQPVWFIGARGSGQSASGYDGMGPEVDHMAQVVKGDLAAKGLGMSLMAVNFADASVNVLKPNATVVALLKQGATAAAITEWIHTSLDAFDASVNDGIQQAEDDAEAAVSQCPNAKLIMGGYSQGAIAIHDAEVWLAAHQPKVSSHIAGTLLLADPDRVPHTNAKTFGSPAAPAGDEGVRTYMCALKYLCVVTPHDVPAPGTTANIVNSGDAVGDFHLSYLTSFSSHATVHTSYAKSVNGTMSYEPVLATAANWVASLIPANPQGGTGRVLASPCLNLRAGPNGSTALVGCIPVDTTIAIACTATGNAVTGPYGTETTWDQTTNNGTTGYVADAWVYTGTNGPSAASCSGPAPAPTGYQTGRQVSVVSQATGGVSGHKGPANSYAAGPTHPANSPLWIVCYVNGQSITGPYGTETAWDLGDDGYYYSDAWIWTGSNSAVVPACSLKNVTVVSQATGGDSGHTGPSNDYAAGLTYPAGATIQIACYVDGQSITGPYGTETIWDLSTDGYYYADAWLWTDSNGAVVPYC